MAKNSVRRRRRQLLKFLGSKNPVWKDADHPELARGSAGWARKLRRESEKRIRKMLHTQNS